jgi:hypothetical protein
MSKLTIVDLQKAEELSASDLGKVAGGSRVVADAGSFTCDPNVHGVPLDQALQVAAITGGPGAVIAAAGAATC